MTKSKKTIEVPLAGWFPVGSEIMLDESFRKLPIDTKVFFFELASEFNYRKRQFYRPDLYYAVHYGVSTRTIKRARKALLARALIEVRRGGFGERGKLMATQYSSVRYAFPEDCPDAGNGFGGFTRMDRYSFWGIIFNLGTTAAWLYLFLVWWQNVKVRKRDVEFYISKFDLNKFVGSPALGAFAKLQDYAFGDGSRLLACSAHHHRLRVKCLPGFDDPGKNENNARIAENQLAEVAARMAKARKKALVVNGTKKPSSRHG